jgi:hypothetical protein
MILSRWLIELYRKGCQRQMGDPALRAVERMVMLERASGALFTSDLHPSGMVPG